MDLKIEKESIWYYVLESEKDTKKLICVPLEKVYFRGVRSYSMLKNLVISDLVVIHLSEVSDIDYINYDQGHMDFGVRKFITETFNLNSRD